MCAGMEGEESGFPPSEPELALRRCLDARTRRWAAAEFFYSAVDRPWFMQNELKVGHHSTFTRGNVLIAKTTLLASHISPSA